MWLHHKHVPVVHFITPSESASYKNRMSKVEAEQIWMKGSSAIQEKQWKLGCNQIRIHWSDEPIMCHKQLQIQKWIRDTIFFIFILFYFFEKACQKCDKWCASEWNLMGCNKKGRGFNWPVGERSDIKLLSTCAQLVMKLTGQIKSTPCNAFSRFIPLSLVTAWTWS